MVKYAITAATGRFGRAAVSHLLTLVDKKDIVLIARNAQKAKQAFKDIEVREASYDSESAMTKALSGIDRVLFISSQPGGEVPRLVQHQNVVNALTTNHVSFVIYTSFPHADESENFLAQDHRGTEQAIVSAKLSHAFLRNNWYLENETSFLQAAASDASAYYWADKKVGWALEREYAEAAANVLANGAEREIYELSGPSINFATLGETVKSTFNASSTIQQVSESDYTSQLEKNGLDHDTALMVTSFQTPIDDGSLAHPSDDLPQLLGHDVTPLSEALKEIIR